MGKIFISPRYVIDITGTDLLSLGELGGKLILKFIFNLRRSDRILMKFDIWKDIVSQTSYFKSRLDPVHCGELGAKILKNA